MESSPVVIGVDIGTTSTKAVAYDGRGRAFAEEDQEYPLHSPQPGRAEQDPEEIFAAVLGTLAPVVEAVEEAGATVSGVSFSAAMHSLLALDEAGNPLTPSITYADNRAAEQAEEIRAEHDGLAIHRRTGTPIHPMSPLAKLRWFQKQDPETYRQAARWVSIKEYVFSKLFGELVVDYSVASATGLFNLENLDWDEEALGLLELSRDKLSRPVPTTHVVDGLDPECAERMGLDPETPFVVGANDGVLANLGVGAVDPGVVACSIGTSGAVRSIVEKPEVDEAGRTFCYALDDGLWVIGGPINNGGIAFQWLRDEVFPGFKYEAQESGRDPYEIMAELAEEVEAGSGGLVFLPYLTGERAPHWNAEVRATFFGLTLQHDRSHMVRAVLEGVMYQMYAVARSLEEVAGEPEEVRATGGFSKSALWRQIMADVFGTEILFPDTQQSSCFGAALLGMKALGHIDTLDVVKSMVSIERRHTPQKEHVRVYKDLVEIFDRLYERLEPEFRAISKAGTSLEDNDSG